VSDATLDLLRDAAVLAHHWWQSRGMAMGSPDTCSCGANTHPVAGDEDVTERRARAFAGHQAEMLAEARQAAGAA
jgi:hypothetical protein